MRIIFFIFIFILFIFSNFINNKAIGLSQNTLTNDIYYQEYNNAYHYALTHKNLTASSVYIKDFKKNFLIIINSKKQTLLLYKPNGLLLKYYTISTSKKGLGQIFGSYKTPFGLHLVVEKIGHNVPNYGIFRNRKFTNQIWQKYLFINNNKKFHKKDFIVTRILRLQGLETGTNRGKNYQGQIVDSLIRGIYIHGTTMEYKLGTPSTIGCIHMSSENIIELFNLVPIGCLVMIY